MKRGGVRDGRMEKEGARGSISREAGEKLFKKTMVREGEDM